MAPTDILHALHYTYTQSEAWFGSNADRGKVQMFLEVTLCSPSLLTGSPHPPAPPWAPC